MILLWLAGGAAYIIGGCFIGGFIHTATNARSGAETFLASAFWPVHAFLLLVAVAWFAGVEVANCGKAATKSPPGD